MSNCNYSAYSIIRLCRSSIAALAMMAIITVSVLAVGTRRGDRSATSVGGLTPQPTPQIIEEVTLTIREEGFTPAELTRPAGRFLLSIDNRSDAEEFTFLINLNGKRMRQIRVQRGTLDWSELINLPAGHYTLTEVNHPAWVCRITVQ